MPNLFVSNFLNVKIAVESKQKISCTCIGARQKTSQKHFILITLQEDEIQCHTSSYARFQIWRITAVPFCGSKSSYYDALNFSNLRTKVKIINKFYVWLICHLRKHMKSYKSLNTRTLFFYLFVYLLFHVSTIYCSLSCFRCLNKSKKTW